MRIVVTLGRLTVTRRFVTFREQHILPQRFTHRGGERHRVGPGIAGQQRVGAQVGQRLHRNAQATHSADGLGREVLGFPVQGFIRRDDGFAIPLFVKADLRDIRPWRAARRIAQRDFLELGNGLVVALRGQRLRGLRH
ncbi:hypothetical protein D9M69_584550 [compost metagenome]